MRPCTRAPCTLKSEVHWPKGQCQRVTFSLAFKSVGVSRQREGAEASANKGTEDGNVFIHQESLVVSGGEGWYITWKANWGETVEAFEHKTE